MLRRLYLTLQFLFLFTTLNAQSYKLLWQNEEALRLAEETMDQMYHWNFVKTDSLLSVYEDLMPKHPSLPLLKAMRVYWDITPFDYQNEDQIDKMFTYLDDCVELCEDRLDEQEDDEESIFFMLLAKSIKARTYNYIGSTWKAVSEARSVYSLTRVGMTLTDSLPEFNFSSGIYNFYREFYPEKHPIYKPFLSFFPPGDKTKGIEQLTNAMKTGVFTSAESHRYLMWIYLHIEDQQSIDLAKDLMSKYQENQWFIYESLLVMSGFDALNDSNAVEKISVLQVSTDSFYILAGQMIEGMRFYEMHDYDEAKKMLLGVEEDLTHLTTRQNYIKPFLYAYLTTIFEIEGDQNNRKKYYKKASQADFGDQVMKRLSARR
ncbi:MULTISPECIES: hypothetical protein [Flammeovirga]|uniref:Uncharacterized protein n=1 Tax=Flammeovirga agarivorans TaxID=2726742 RepID=A0A7X8XZ83_9BACT|nr:MULTISPECIES: hypothetical protein [Flammeovirga]NLR94745.1 hypothetical protein [Flammeovirga agarivorans]